MANDFLSDEEYLDSLLEKVSQDDQMNSEAEEQLQQMLQSAEPDSFQDISIDQLIAGETGDSDAEQDVGKMSLEGLNGSDEDLLGSLDSIVKEMKENADEEESAEGEKRSKKKTSKSKKAKKVKNKNGFAEKIKNAFFKVEMVDPQEEILEEEKRQQAKEDKKKAKALEAEQKKIKQQEDKKAAEARKKETAQKKKLEKEQRHQEKLAKKAEREATLGPEERVKLKPAFLAFMVTVVAGMTIAVVLASNHYSYQYAMNSAQKSFKNGNYAKAYQVLSGMEIKKQDQEFFNQIHMLVRIENQYDSYVNYRELQMPKEALHSLMQGLNLYYDSVDMAQEYQLEQQLDFQKDTLLYSLANDYGLDEEKAKMICQIEDSNEYTREIELYSSNLTQ